jgi:hypothetical protein
MSTDCKCAHTDREREREREADPQIRTNYAIYRKAIRSCDDSSLWYLKVVRARVEHVGVRAHQLQLAAVDHEVPLPAK